MKPSKVSPKNVYLTEDQVNKIKDLVRSCPVKVSVSAMARFLIDEALNKVPCKNPTANGAELLKDTKEE